MSWAVTYNCEEIRRQLEKKSGSSPPPVSTVKYWKQRFIETGSVEERKRTERTHSATPDDNKENIIQMETNDTISTRLNVFPYRIILCARKKIYDYKAETSQLLLEDDTDKRLEFTHIVLQRYQNDPVVLRKIQFSDECVFALNSRFNHQNVHKWTRKNPHFKNL